MFWLITGWLVLGALCSDRDQTDAVCRRVGAAAIAIAVSAADEGLGAALLNALIAVVLFNSRNRGFVPQQNDVIYPVPSMNRVPVGRWREAADRGSAKRRTMDFTEAEIAQLSAALSGHFCEGRDELLPLILVDWGRVELKEHLKYPSPVEDRAQQRQLKNLSRYATGLAQSISCLNSSVSALIVDQQLSAFVPHKPGSEVLVLRAGVTQEQLLEADRRLAEMPATLKNIAIAAENAAAEWQPHPMRPITLRGHLVLRDLATIFEYTTGERASRKTHVEPHEDAGREYGAFFDLSCAAWQIIFKSRRGLSYRLQQWAEKRKNCDGPSPLIANISLRHPEWRIFG
jgi:hypothetical protein